MHCQCEFVTQRLGALWEIESLDLDVIIGFKNVGKSSLEAYLFEGK